MKRTNYLFGCVLVIVGLVCIQVQAQTTPTLRETRMSLQRQLQNDLNLRVRNTREALDRHVRERATIEANRRLVRQGKEVAGFVDLLPEEDDALNSMDKEYTKHQKRLATLSAVHEKLSEKGNYTAMEQLEKALKKENERHDRKMGQLHDKRKKAKGKGKKDNPGLKKGHDKNKGAPNSVTVIKGDEVRVQDAPGSSSKGAAQGKGQGKGNGKGKGKGKK